MMLNKWCINNKLNRFSDPRSLVGEVVAVGFSLRFFHSSLSSIKNLLLAYYFHSITIALKLNEAVAVDNCSLQYWNYMQTSVWREVDRYGSCLGNKHWTSICKGCHYKSIFKLNCVILIVRWRECVRCACLCNDVEYDWLHLTDK